MEALSLNGKLLFQDGFGFIAIGPILILIWLILSNPAGRLSLSIPYIDLLGAIGIGLIALGLSLVTITRLYKPVRGELLLKLHNRQYTSVVIIVLIGAITFNSLAGHVLATIPEGGNGRYDEQIGMTFSADLPRVDVNVTAIAQVGDSRSGPAYLLNGLSNASYWYQVGIAWDWNGPTLRCDTDFTAAYDVFNPNNTEILAAPSGGGGGIQSALKVHQADLVLLSLYFNNGNVIMYVKDWNTGSTSQEVYPAFGATYFKGLRNVFSSRGFFTGVMTEQDHDGYYYGAEQRVAYTWSKNQTNTSAVMWTDEYVLPNPNSILFSVPQYINYNSTPDVSFAIYGAFAESNQQRFVTGQLPIDPPPVRWACSALALLT